MDGMELEQALHAARALVLADLMADDVADADIVSLVEDAVVHRRWWVEQWPEGVGIRRGTDSAGRPGRAAGEVRPLAAVPRLHRVRGPSRAGRRAGVGARSALGLPQDGGRGGPRRQAADPHRGLTR